MFGLPLNITIGVITGVQIPRFISCPRPWPISGQFNQMVQKFQPNSLLTESGLTVILALSILRSEPMNDTMTCPIAAADLAFARSHPDGRLDPWCHDVAGDWGAQCQAGRAFAADFLEHLRSTDNIPLLPAIARRITERGTFGGVECGFFTALAERLD